MTDSQLHLAFATGLLVTGVPCLLVARRIATWLCQRTWMNGQPELLTKVYASVTTERGIRWIGVFLLAGAVAQLWASWLMSGRFNQECEVGSAPG